MTTKRVTNSELQTFKDCRRKWWLGWHRKYRLAAEKPVGAAKTGTRVHEALAPLYDPANAGKAIDILAIIRDGRERDLQACADDPDLCARVQKESDLAEIMVEGYVDWLAETGVDSGLELLAAEEEVTEPFPVSEESLAGTGWTNVELMGKVDARLRRVVDQVILFLDHKTVGSLDITGLDLDEQMLFYHLLMHLKWTRTQDPLDRPAGALYNMLRKVKRTTRATPPFYDRHLITHTDVELSNMWTRVWGEVLELARVTAQLNNGVDHHAVAWPRPSRDCSWKCEFLPVCKMFDDGSDAEGFLKSFYRQADPLDRYDDKQGDEV